MPSYIKQVGVYGRPYLDNYSQVSTIVPPQWPFEVSIAGHNYVVDTSFEPYRRDAFRHRSIPPQREAITFDNIPGEGTINTAGLWRRGMEDWSLGAGQIFLDRKQSTANRFYRSKGVNPWVQWQLNLQPDVKRQYALDPDEVLIRALAVGTNVYIMRSGEVQWTSDWTTFHTVTGLPTSAMVDITTDGFNVYIACWDGTMSGPGIYTTENGTTTSTHYLTTGNFNSIAYVNDRLMAGSGPSLFNITNAIGQSALTGGTVSAGTTIWQIPCTAIPQAVQTGDLVTVGGTDTFVAADAAAIGATLIYVTAQATNTSHTTGDTVVDQNWVQAGTPLFTHNNPNWIWTCFAGGSSEIYCGGYSTQGGYTDSVNGGASGVYRTALDTDGTTLTAPTVALPLEGGEFCTALASYLNFIFVGTNYGVRMCQTLAAYDPTGNLGDLRAGALIPNITQPVTVPVYGIVGSGRFVWFTWSDYDEESTGLGRMDLTNFIDALAPAYASDLMIPGDGPCYLDWDPITNSPLIALQSTANGNSPGVYTQDPNNVVAEGSVESGQIGFDLPDDKVAMTLQPKMIPPINGTIAGFMAIDQPLGTNYFAVGIRADSIPQLAWNLPQLRGELYQVKLTLGASEDGDGPTLSRWTLKAFPGVATPILIECILVMDRRQEEKGTMIAYDPYTEYAYLETLRQRQAVIQYVEGPFVENVIITQLDWLPNLENVGGDQSGYDTTMTVTMQTLTGE